MIEYAIYLLGCIIAGIVGALTYYKLELIKEFFLALIKRLFESPDKTQSIQVNVVSSLSVIEVKEIANDVYVKNFTELVSEARKIGLERANWLNDNVVNRGLSPHQLSKFCEPDIQHTLFNVQSSFVKTGDKYLGDLLIDLLIRRLDTEPRTYDQILYDEAIHVVPKLTNFQLDVLALTYSIRWNPKYLFTDIDDYRKYLAKTYLSFLTNIDSSLSPNEFREQLALHFISLGCGERPAQHGQIGHFQSYFRGYIWETTTEGFTLEEYKSITKDNKELDQLITSSIIIPNNYRISNPKDFNNKRNKSPDLKEEYEALYLLSHKYAQSTNVNKLDSIEKKIPELIEIRTKTKDIPAPDLLPLGILIARAHIDAKIQH